MDKRLEDREIKLGDVLQVVDEWLKSDDTYVVDKYGHRIKGATMECMPMTLTTRLSVKVRKDAGDN